MKYLELFESFELYQMICESNVEFSQEFLNVLGKMENDLAKKVMSLSGQDHKVSTNYFSLPPHENGNDLITFITDRKAKELGALIKNEWEVTQLDRHLNNSETNTKYFQIFGMEVPKDINYPTVGTIGKIDQTWISPSSGKTWVKFTPTNGSFPSIILNKEALIPNGPTEKIFYEENRQSTRVGRGIRSLLSASGIKFTDKEIETFVNQWKSTVDKINDIFYHFEEVKGSDIAHWYNCHNYEMQDRGQLGNSCMKSVDKDYFDIYVNNPDVISMIIYKSPTNSSKIKGRALLWKINDDKFFMDRIYTNHDSDIDLFKQYAKKMGWYSKLYNQSSEEMDCISPFDGKRVNLGNPEIALSKSSYDLYPYMDTLKYYNPTTGIISNIPKKGCLVLESTGGHGDPWQSEMLWVEFYDDEFPEEDLTWCEYADLGYRDSIQGGSRLSEDCYFDEYYQVYVANSFRDEHMIECFKTGEYRLEKDVKKIYSSDSRAESKFVTKDYVGDDLKYSSYHDEFIPSDKAVEVYTVCPSDRATNKSKDWRAVSDSSWKEIDGVKYDKGILIEKDINR